MHGDDYLDRLVRRLESVHPLNPDDKAALRALPLQVSKLRARQDLVREGERSTKCCIVFDGMTCWYKMIGDGKRQILSFQLPGDIPDLQGIHLPRMDSTLMTISQCIVGFVDHSALRALCALRPVVSSALWRTSLIDAAIFREWVANVGSRQGYQRLAHLFCEQATRLGAVGLVEGDFTFRLPLTQTELGDAMGLSTVHVNRSLQDLRKQRLLRFDRSVMKVLDWARLQEVGDFDPSYLFLADPFASTPA